MIHPSFRLVQPHREKMLEQRVEGSGSVDLDFEQPIYGFSVSGMWYRKDIIDSYIIKSKLKLQS